MSRCFPFPPPGYEKKPTTDDIDLLKKEKRKEKKHKKDKKDKERKEGKEKREKDRSEGKHKEKKDKKDKHRDKKKDKEKGKTSTQDEGHNGEKLHHIHNNEQIQDKKQFLQFRNGESNKDKTSSSEDKRQPSTQFQTQNGDLARNRDSENFKFVQELDRRIRDEEKGMGSHQFLVEGRKNSYNEVEMQNAMARNKINGATPPTQPPPPPPPQPPLPPPPQPPLDHKIDRRFDQKEKMQESDDRRGDKRKNKDRDKQRAGKEKNSEKEKTEKSKEKSERDKNKHIKKSDLSMATLNSFPSHILENSFQGIGSEGILKKRKELETNGVSHEYEPRPNKMARPISNISPENGRKLDFPQNPSPSFLDNQKASQNNFKMGSKSQKVNGLIPSPPLSLPTKKPPIAALNHLHHKPSPIKSPPPPPVITNHVAAQSLPVTTTKPPPPPQSIPIPIPAQSPPVSITKQPVSRPKPPPKAVAAAPPPPPPKKKSESVKPPHPDTKYLNQILSVPKLEEWGAVDDQEWLFNTAAPPLPPPEKAETMAEVQVWSEAKHIETVDVCALPYVIPY